MVQTKTGTAWRKSFRRIGLLPLRFAPPTEVVLLHFAHTAPAAGSFLAAASCIRLGLGNNFADTSRRALSEILLDVVARQSKAGAQRRVGVLGVARVQQLIDLGVVLDDVEVDSVTGGSRAEVDGVA